MLRPIRRANKCFERAAHAANEGSTFHGKRYFIISLANTEYDTSCTVCSDLFLDTAESFAGGDRVHLLEVGVFDVADFALLGVELELCVGRFFPFRHGRALVAVEQQGDFFEREALGPAGSWRVSNGRWAKEGTSTYSMKKKYTMMLKNMSVAIKMK